jgi:MFS family permease
MSPPDPPAASRAAIERNIGLFLAFRILFHTRLYYPVFMVMFLDYGITVEEFGLLNAIWAATIVLLEVPSGALADLVGRRRLVVAGAVLMVAEMLLLVLVPVPSPWVLPALVCNRIVSGAAEAFVSGADEALAYDSLVACGRTGEWPRVLERLMRWSGVATIVGMIAGSLLYDPAACGFLVRVCGLDDRFAPGPTFRLPIWLTLACALGACAAAGAMREPPRAGAGGPSAGTAPAAGLAAAFRQTAATGRWILARPLVLCVIVAGVLVDLPIRQVLVVSSELYREIGIPAPAFGLVAAASALFGLAVAGPLRRLAVDASPRANAAVIAAVTLAGLLGTAAFVPLAGGVFVIALATALRMMTFIQSYYLNQLVDSARRATVLSFRGLAVNVAYGVGSLGFAVATGAIDRLAPDGPTFRVVVGLLPACFALSWAAFTVWVRRGIADRGPLRRRGGFGTAVTVAAGA